MTPTVILNNSVFASNTKGNEHMVLEIIKDNRTAEQIKEIKWLVCNVPYIINSYLYNRV